MSKSTARPASKSLVTTTASMPSVASAAPVSPDAFINAARSVLPHEAIPINTPVKEDTTDRDLVREQAQFTFWHQLWVGTKKVESFTSFGSADVDDALTACWGPYTNTDPYTTPFNGATVPVQYRIAKTVVTKTVRIGGNETVTEDGQKSIDALRAHDGWADVATTRVWSMEYPKTVVHSWPIGTRLGDLTDKNLARMIWAVRESLPRVLKGKDRNKYSRAIAVLLGRETPAAAPTVEGVDADTVRKVLAAIASK